MKDKQELERRRSLLSQSIGDYLQLKRSALKRNDPLRYRHGKLIEVRRTLATLDFHNLGKWNVPISQILLPHSVEPLPGQQELFAVEEEASR